MLTDAGSPTYPGKRRCGTADCSCRQTRPAHESKEALLSGIPLAFSPVGQGIASAPCPPAERDRRPSHVSGSSIGQRSRTEGGGPFVPPLQGTHAAEGNP